MPAARISLARSAVTDIEDIRSWYAAQGASDTGRRLVGEILARIAGLADLPDMGRVVPEFGQAYLRELIHPPYRIVYRRDDPARVRIVRVWRGERRLTLPDPSTR